MKPSWNFCFSGESWNIHHFDRFIFIDIMPIFFCQLMYLSSFVNSKFVFPMNHCRLFECLMCNIILYMLGFICNPSAWLSSFSIFVAYFTFYHCRQQCAFLFLVYFFNFQKLIFIILIRENILNSQFSSRHEENSLYYCLKIQIFSCLRNFINFWS